MHIWTNAPLRYHKNSARLTKNWTKSRGKSLKKFRKTLKRIKWLNWRPKPSGKISGINFTSNKLNRSNLDKKYLSIIWKTLKLRKKQRNVKRNNVRKIGGKKTNKEYTKEIMQKWNTGLRCNINSKKKVKRATILWICYAKNVTKSQCCAFRWKTSVGLNENRHGNL